MKTIWKFPVNGRPFSAPVTKFLDVRVQDENVFVWVEVDTNMDESKYMVFPICTGDIVEDKMCYISTILFGEDGSYVLHYYWARV